MTSAGEQTREVRGRTVRLPVEVRDCSAGTATFLADHAATAALLPAGLVPIRVAPRHTLVTLVMVDYRDNDLGDYDEAAIQLTVTRPGLSNRIRTLRKALTGSPETFTVAMPVNQQFTLDAGRSIWGFPKTLDDVRVDEVDGVARSTWRADDRHVWTLRVPTGSDRAMPAPPLQTWTVIDGRLHRTSFAMSAEHGSLHLGNHAQLDLGDHPTADLLRRLGLPRRSLLTTWMQDAKATFGAPEPVT